MDAMCVLPFTPEFMRLSPETFTHTVLVEHLHAAQVVVGENFTYGHRAAGNVGTLAAEGRRFGFAVEGVPLAEDMRRTTATSPSPRPTSGPAWRPATWSSAARALGRPHRVDGVVVRGRPPGPGPGLPDGERGEPAVHRHPGRRRLRRAPGDPRPAQRRQPRAAARPRSRSAPTRRSRAAGAPSRRSCSTTTATSTASTSASSSSQRLRPMAAFADVDGLLAAMAKDVDGHPRRSCRPVASGRPCAADGAGRGM